MRKGSIHQLVVNLRCEWCKQLFPWKPLWHARVAQRLPKTCSERCQIQLREWHRNMLVEKPKAEKPKDK